MNLIRAKCQLFQIRTSSTIVVILGILILIARYPALDGEDIMNARNNLNSELPITYWGGFSSLFYGQFPNLFSINWQTLLVIFQVTVCAFSLIIMLRKIQITTTFQHIVSTLIIYLSLAFSSQTTRDGTMFSLLVLSASLYIFSKNNQKANKSIIVIATITLIISLTFRPWLAISLIPILIYLNVIYSNTKKSISLLLTIMVLCLPVVFEKTASKILNLNDSFPEQQVFITDFASTYCYSNNNNSAKIALQSLEKFTNEQNYNLKICNYFRLDNYHSLIQEDSNVLSAQELQTQFALLKFNQRETYNEIRASWLKLVLSDPVTYLQNKIQMATKLIIASDTRGLRIFNAKTFKDQIGGAIFIIYDLAITLHLMSLLALLILLFFVNLFNSKLDSLKGIFVPKDQLLLICSAISWLVCSAIAYIGSNGRYTYSITLLIYLFLLRDNINKNSNLKNQGLKCNYS